MQRFTLAAIERQMANHAQIQISSQRHKSILATSSSILSLPKDPFQTTIPANNQVLLKAFYSQRPGFFQNILSNIQQEAKKSKEMQESLKKFREEAKKLEESEALKEARRKFENIEGESKNVFKDQIASKFKGTIDEISKAEAVKKAGEFTSNLGKTAGNFGKVAGEAAENIGKSGVFKSATEAATNLKTEIEGQRLGGTVYRPPAALRKRKSDTRMEDIEINTEATGVELHKDSKFYASWQNFKENNTVYNKFIDYRAKYEESDNPLVRGARMVTDKVQGLMGGSFMNTELSQVLTEIVKMDPNFCQEQFLKDCERDIIPNILESFIQGDLEILQDWCFEAPFSILSTPIKQAQQLGYTFHSRILDIENVDLFMGKMTEQGPVLAITFTSQMIECLKDANGKIVQGDPDKVMRIQYAWVLCRDQAELDPKAAWRLMEIAIQSANEQFL